MEHFAFPGNIDFAADDHGTRFLFYSWKADMFIHRLWIMFTIGESRAISHTNDTEDDAQQVTVIHRRRKFSTETPLENVD